MIPRAYPHLNCAECGISLADGYALDCKACSDRRTTRLRRGDLFTPTGYAGELIDNTSGRLVAGEIEAA